MIVRQYIHELNSTEIGNTNTNETYISVRRGLAPSLTFLKEGDVNIIFKQDGMEYALKYQVYRNGEFRITKLGRLYRKIDVTAGDLIQVEDANGILYLDFVHRPNLVVLSCKKGEIFECLNEDRIVRLLNREIRGSFRGTVGSIRISSSGTLKPRSDSERTINTYRMAFNGKTVESSKDTLFNIFLVNESVSINEAKRDIVCEFSWEGYE